MLTGSGTFILLDTRVISTNWLLSTPFECAIVVMSATDDQLRLFREEERHLKAFASLRHRLGMRPDRDEKGQALLEMTFGTIFLLLIVLVVFEMAMLFYSYIALLNASREGAVYASLHPDMEPGSEEYEAYLAVTENEALAAGLNTTTGYFTITEPINTDCISVTVKVDYKIVNPTQGIILPWLGRMGLFQSAIMSASEIMRIRPGAPCTP
jgi:Flp pilus assembly protein TadG